MEQLLLKLAEHGLVALLLALALYALYKLFLRYEAVQKARIDDAVAYVGKLSAAFDIVDALKAERTTFVDAFNSERATFQAAMEELLEALKHERGHR